MLTLGNKCALHLSLTASILLAGGVLRVDSVETNVLKSSGNGSSELIISAKARRMLEPRENQWFRYRVDGEEYAVRILSVNGGENEGNTILLLESSHAHPLLNVSYRLGRRSLWSEMLGLNSSLGVEWRSFRRYLFSFCE